MMQGVSFSSKPVEILGNHEIDLEGDYGDSLDVFSHQRIRTTNEAVDQVSLIHT